MNALDLEMAYEGYRGVNLDRFQFNRLKNVVELNKIINSDPSYISLNKSLMELDPLTLEETFKIAKDFFVSHFNIHNIYCVDEPLLDKIVADLPDDTPAHDAYEAINGILTSINPFDIPTEIRQDCDVDSRIVKPVCIVPGHPSEDNRRIYFSKIKFGKSINELTPTFVAHEMTHLETMSNIGYTDDYLNREILSIFVEKIAALKMDKTGKLLRLSEKLRNRDLVNQYAALYKNLNNISREDMMIKMTYIKSTLIAEKLFDMYLRERKEKNRDKYIYDVQDVMDGKVKVEEILAKRDITPSKCLDLSYLKRHV